MKKTVSSNLGLYTTEDPWIRYADPVAGDDGNDGKSPATAWLTLTHALRMRPRICNFSLIKCAAGTFVENINVEESFGGFILAGTFVETYDACAVVSYTVPGPNTVEGYPELVVDYSGQAGWVSDDTLLDMYVEFLDNVGPIPRKFRMKIIDYADLGLDRCRLILAGSAEAASINAVDPELVLTQHGTIIQGDAGASTLTDVVTIRGNNRVAQDASYSRAYGRGPTLYGLYIQSVVAGTSAVLVETGAHVSNGPVMVEAAANGRAFECYGAASHWRELAQLAPGVGAIVDPNFIYAGGPGWLAAGPCSTVTTSQKNAPNYSLFILGTDTYMDSIDLNRAQSFLSGQRNQKIAFTTFYKAAGEVYLTEGANVTWDNRVTLGSNVRAERKYGARVIAVIVDTGTMSFRDDPDTLFGRIYLAGAEFVTDGPMDCGDVTDPTLICPIISVVNESILKCKNITIGALGAECVTANALIRVTGESVLHPYGLLKAYHVPVASQPVLDLGRNSEALFDAITPNIEIHTESPVDLGTGIIQVEGQSRFHCVDNVTIEHTVNGGSGHSLLVIESDAYIEGDYVSDTVLTGYDLVAYEARLKIEGAVDMDTSGKCMWFHGANARGRFGGAVVVNTCGTTAPIILVENVAQVDHYGDIKIKSQDYGETAIIHYLDLARVSWYTTVYPGDASWNKNTNLGASYGVRIKRGSQLVCSQNSAGPIGVADLDLGIVGAAPWQATGDSISDIPTGGVGGENTAELTVVHCR